MQCFSDFSSPVNLLAKKRKWTHELWLGEYLAGNEGIFLRRLVWVFMGDLAEAGHAAGQLALLQGLQVTLVQAVHGASTHTPVEVVHRLSLWQRTPLSYQVSSKKWSTIKHKHMHTRKHTVDTHSRNHAVQVQGGGRLWGRFPPHS